MHADTCCSFSRRLSMAFETQLMPLSLTHSQIDGRLVHDKQLSSCAAGVDLDVGSGYSARLMD